MIKYVSQGEENVGKSQFLRCILDEQILGFTVDMDKLERKSKVLVRVEFLDTTRLQKIIGRYLKNSGEAKSIVMVAVSAYVLGEALSADNNTTRYDLEYHGRKSRRELLQQVQNLDDLYLIKHQIDLQSNQQREIRPQKISPSPLVNNDEEDEKDEDENDNCISSDDIPGIVLDF